MSYSYTRRLGETGAEVYCPDVTTGTPVAYSAAPKKGRIISLRAVQQSGTLAGSDTVITPKVNGVAITGATITLTSGGTAGTVTSVDLRALIDGTSLVVESDKITFSSDGGANDSTVPFMFSATIRP